MSEPRSIAPRAPTILRSIAVAGVIVSIVGTIVIWIFLSDLETTTDRSLLIGEQATVTLQETIDIADQVLAAVDDGLVTVESTLRTVDDVLQSTAGIAEATGSLSSTLPASFENIDAALATVERLGQTVDSALSTLADLPFGPNYNPDVPFPEAVANLREALAPIGDDLAQVSEELQGFGEGSSQLTADIDALVTDVEHTRDALSGTDALLEQYREAAEDAGRLAAQTRNDLPSSVNRMRFVTVALALLLIASQFVPWTLASLIEGWRRDEEPVVSPPMSDAAAAASDSPPGSASEEPDATGDITATPG
jgi:hypothetical protein